MLFESGVQVEVRLPRALVREGEPPDLVALCFVEAAEVGHKAVEQVGFGDQHIDREVNAQLFVQFDQAFAQRAGLGGARFGAVAQQIGDADGHHHAVDRLTGAVFFQQRDEALPLAGVFFALAFLRGVAAGGVEQHGVVGKPPVAVAGAAHAAQRGFAEAIRQREVQAGVDQRGGLAGAGRADDHIPRQLVQVLAAKAGHPAVFAVALARCEARLFQQLRRFVEALRQLIVLFDLGLAVFRRHRFGGAQVAQQAAVEPGAVEARDQSAQ